MQKEKISIIIPVYNVEPYIKECLNSVVNQTYDNIEIIIVDDGSNDGSSEICDYFAEIDDRVRVIHKSNEKQAVARNTALDLCTGDYIGFVDSDDYIELDFYETLIGAIIYYKANIAMCSHFTKYCNNEKLFRTLPYDKDTVVSSESFASLIDFHINSPWDKLYSRNIFNKLRFPIGQYYEDLYISLDILKKSSRIVYVPQSKYHYRIRNTSTINSFDQIHMDDLLLAFEHLANVSQSYGNNVSLSVFARKCIELQFCLMQKRYLNSCEWQNNFLKILRKDLIAIILKTRIHLKRKILIFLTCISPNFCYLLNRVEKFAIKHIANKADLKYE